MSQTTLSLKGHVYEVDADSTLGVQISNYAKRCVACNNAIREFMLSIEQKYSFPIPVTDDTTYCLSDDCDAGGLMAIVVSKKDFVMVPGRAHVIWDTMPSLDNQDELYVLPRIEANTHFIRYGKAVELFKSNAPDWVFQPSTGRGDDNGKCLHVTTYDKVRSLISKGDRDALVGKNGTTPSPAIRLAVGKQYRLNTETLTDCPERSGDVSTQNFRDAVALYKEWMSLPTVPANTLARMLRLKSNGIDNKFDADSCFCEWRFDSANKRYLIHTGLVSSLVEMHETTDPSALAFFTK